jgi:prepilin-type processing-associated H-X9-DG protein
VFAKAREKARATQCLNNQKQIVTGILMYAQDHEELLPTSDTVWGAIGLDKGVYQCPTAGTKIPIAYVYDDGLSGRAIGEIANPSDMFVTTDGSNGAVDRRHSGKLIFSALDGHVELATDPGQIQLVGHLEKLCPANGSGIAPTVLIYDPAQPDAGNPALDLATYTGGSNYTKIMMMQTSAVGSNGYVLCNSASPSQAKIKAPFTGVVMGGTNGGYWGPRSSTTIGTFTGDTNALEPNLKPLGGAASDVWDGAYACDSEFATVTVKFTGFCRLITLVCPKDGQGGAGQGAGFVMKAAQGGGQSIQVMNVAPNTNLVAKIFQFLVPSSPAVFSFNNGASAAGGRNYPGRACGVNMVLLDD